MQARSEYHRDGIRNKRGVAEIFFSTNKYRLDTRDKQTIVKVATGIKMELALGRKPELWMVAEADHRGDDERNRRLSEKRLYEVANYLSRSLVYEPNFTYVWACAAGERLRTYMKGAEENWNNPKWLSWRRKVHILARKPQYYDFEGNNLKFYKYELGCGTATKTRIGVPIKLEEPILLRP